MAAWVLLPPPQPDKAANGGKRMRAAHSRARRLRSTGNKATRPTSGSMQAAIVNWRPGLFNSSAAVAVALVETVNVVLPAADPVSESDAGLKLQAAYAGSPVHERLTGPEKPAVPATLNVVEADWPAFTVRLVVPPPTETPTGASIA